MNKFYLESTYAITGEFNRKEISWKALVHFLSLNTTKHVETKVEQGKRYAVYTHVFESIRNDYHYKIIFENGCLFD